ncbi:di-heme cytochrome c peroxidase domain protein [Burkholderia pseudomallei MSHR4032]|nr:di-heme cytochrome c peroxidase domain protein [Burkholderia pseudomallei MSHR4032]
MPPAYRGNINVNSTPMNRRPGTPPALTEAEIDDLVAFLGTLTDARYAAGVPPHLKIHDSQAFTIAP